MKTTHPKPQGPFHQFSRGLLLVALVVLGNTAAAADANWSDSLAFTEDQAVIDRAVQKWRSQFGPVDFAEQKMFRCMVYLQPQPKSAFTPFTTEKRSEKLQLELQVWVRYVFKGPFNGFVSQWTPSRYYLNQGRLEPSLLMYEGSFDRYSITMLENYNVFFFTIAQTNRAPSTGFAGQEVASILTNWLSITNQQVARDFSLPDSVVLGQVFTNRKQPEVGKIRDWRDYIVGFQSTEGLCLMIFKAHAERASGSFPYDFNWLNKGLFQSNQTTLVDPPRNEQLNNPFGVGRPVKLRSGAIP
jgi:hypothetical protein